jgi:organic radical activating enzyme
LQGTINSIPVVLKVDSSFEIESEQQQVTLNGGNTALNTMDLSQLTVGLSATDFTNAVQTNGTIIISMTSNTNLFNTIFANLQKQGETEVELHHH